MGQLPGVSAAAAAAALMLDDLIPPYDWGCPACLRQVAKNSRRQLATLGGPTKRHERRARCDEVVDIGSRKNLGHLEVTC